MSAAHLESFLRYLGGGGTFQGKLKSAAANVWQRVIPETGQGLDHLKGQRLCQAVQTDHLPTRMECGTLRAPQESYGKVSQSSGAMGEEAAGTVYQQT